MAAAPEDGDEIAVASRFGSVARVVKEHPLMLALSILGTVATFIVGTARVTDLVLDGGRDPIGDTVSAEEIELPLAESYEYATVEDESGAISVEMPTVWGSVFGNGWHARSFQKIPEGKIIGPGLNASPSVERWREDLETPGAFIGASREILAEYSPEEVLQQIAFRGCETIERRSYTNADHTGALVTWDCEGGAQWRVLAAIPTESRAYLIYVQAKLVSSADVEAYNRILGTFEVDFGA